MHLNRATKAWVDSDNSDASTVELALPASGSPFIDVPELEASGLDIWRISRRPATLFIEGVVLNAGEQMTNTKARRCGSHENDSHRSAMPGGKTRRVAWTVIRDGL